jgi:hypothetical protein
MQRGKVEMDDGEFHACFATGTLIVELLIHAWGLSIAWKRAWRISAALLLPSALPALSSHGCHARRRSSAVLL